jgi:hypothetical protein
MLSEMPNGGFVLDMDKFDQVMPTAPTEGFPFPQIG